MHKSGNKPDVALKSLWSDLSNAGLNDSLLEVPSISTGVQTGYGPVRLALGLDSELRVLVPCGEDTLFCEFDSSSRLTVEVVKYSCNGNKSLFIDITCREEALNAVFSELADEILRRLSDGKAPAEAVSGTISDFKILLKADPPASVSFSVVLGLLGEWAVLREMSRFGVNPADCWQGPWEQRHDFRAGNLALEVKTTSRSDSVSVKIAGHDQLLPPAAGELVLVLVRMEPVSNGRVTVGGLFGELINAGVKPLRLRAGLAELGCLDPYADEWNRNRFELQSMSAWRVVDGFPRLTHKEFPGGIIPPGVSRLSYVIDTTHAEEFSITSDDFTKYLKRMIT